MFPLNLMKPWTTRGQSADATGIREPSPRVLATNQRKLKILHIQEHDMKKFAPIVTGIVMVLLALAPAAHGGDELEGTMEVLDSLSDLQGDFSAIRGSGKGSSADSQYDDDAAARDEALNAAAEEALVRKFTGIEDDFEHDDVNNDFDEDIDDDDNFDDDDKIDYDRIANEGS